MQIPNTDFFRVLRMVNKIVRPPIERPHSAEGKSCVNGERAMSRAINVAVPLVVIYPQVAIRAAAEPVDIYFIDKPAWALSCIKMSDHCSIPIWPADHEPRGVALCFRALRI